jgi:hypothetical protein
MAWSWNDWLIVNIGNGVVNIRERGRRLVNQTIIAAGARRD